MNNFNFYSPTYFAFGKDREQDAGALVKRFGGKKVLIHYGGGSVVRSGLLERVKASLEAESIPLCNIPEQSYALICATKEAMRYETGLWTDAAAQIGKRLY